MNLDEYADKKALETIHNCDSDYSSLVCQVCIAEAIKSAYTQGCSDTKRGAVEAVTALAAKWPNNEDVAAGVMLRHAEQAVTNSTPTPEAKDEANSNDNLD